MIEITLLRAIPTGILAKYIKFQTLFQIQSHLFNDFYNRVDSKKQICKLCLTLFLPNFKKSSKSTSGITKMTSDIATNDPIMYPIHHKTNTQSMWFDELLTKVHIPMFGRANDRKVSYPYCSVEEMISKLHDHFLNRTIWM